MGGADVNAKDASGNTALHYIAARGLQSGTAYLLEKGAKADEQNNQGSTPFHKACNTGQLQVPQKLVEFKCNVNTTDQQGNTGLHLAVRGKHEILLQWLMGLPDGQKPDLAVKNNAGQTPKDCAVVHNDNQIAAMLQ